MAKRLMQAEYVHVARSIRSVLVPDCYRYAPAPRWRWLQDLAWAFLMRVGALRAAHRDEETWEVRQVDVAKLSHLILTQATNIMAEHDIEPKRIIMGEHEYRELMRDGPLNVYVSAQVPSFNGMRIEIVPWMRGVIVLP